MSSKKEEAISLLERCLERTRKLGPSMHLSPNFNRWLRNTRLAISHVFGADSKHINEFNALDFASDASSRYVDSGALLESMLEEVKDYWPNEDSGVPQESPAEKSIAAASVNPCIFLGHGRSKLWARLKIFLEDELHLETITYESESRVGESIVPVLEKLLAQATFAVLVLTAEDETRDGMKRARQNVVHEAGLFQGRLGFKKAVVLRQENLEDFTNIAGLQYISFKDDNIETTFYELQRVFKREGLLPDS